MSELKLVVVVHITITNITARLGMIVALLLENYLALCTLSWASWILFTASFHTSFVLAVILLTFQVFRLVFCIRLMPTVVLNDSPPHISVTLFWSTQWHMLRAMRIMKLFTVYFCIVLWRRPWYAACTSSVFTVCLGQETSGTVVWNVRIVLLLQNL